MAGNEINIQIKVANKQALEAVKQFTKQFDKATVKIQQDAEKIKTASKLGKIAQGVKNYGIQVGIAIGAVYGLAKAVGKLTDAYSKQEEADVKLHQILVATGQYTPELEQKLKDLANGFQEVTKYGNETTQEAEAIMLTFRNVGQNVFPQAIESAMDMSTVFGQDLKQSVIQLGTALNDPIQGIGRLRRIGISFSEEQKKQIENFIKQNDLASAQKVILAELQKEVGGAAKAMGDTYAGSVTKLKNAYGDLKETIGEFMANQMKPMVPAITKIVNKINDWIRAKLDLKAAYDLAKKSIDEVTDANRAEYIQAKISVKQHEIEVIQKKLEHFHRRKVREELEKELAKKKEELRQLKASKEAWDRFLQTQKEAAEAEKKAAEAAKKQAEATKNQREETESLYRWNDRINHVLKENEKRYKAVARVQEDVIKGTNSLKHAWQKVTPTAEQYNDLLNDLKNALNNVTSAEKASSNTLNDIVLPRWQAAWEAIGDQTKTAEEKIKESIKIIFVDLLRAIGKQMLIAAASYAISLQWGKAALATALSAAAFSAASYINSFQQGGEIPGFGGGDSKVVNVEPGEYVVRKEVAQNNRATLNAMNAGEIMPIQVTVYLGTKLIYNEISKATQNGQIIIDKRAVR